MNQRKPSYKKEQTDKIQKQQSDQEKTESMVRNCREIICIFLESMLIYVMNEFSDSGGHFHGT